MDLVQVDVVDVESTQALVDRPHHPTSGVAPSVDVVAHRPVELRRQDDVVSSTGDRPADDQLVLAGSVHVGGVDQVDPCVEGALDDPGAFGEVAVAPHPEHHRAQTEAADVHTGIAEDAVVRHHVRPRTNGWASARGWRTRVANSNITPRATT